MGKINNSFGFDNKRTKKLGKFYNTIDFEVKTDYRIDEFKNESESPVVGYFEIGTQRYPVTFAELSLIEEKLARQKIQSIKVTV